MKRIWNVLVFVLTSLLIMGCVDPKTLDPISVYLYMDADTLYERIESHPGLEMELPIPEKTGHYFVGWYLDPLFLQSSKMIIKPTTELVLYARFDINHYLIHFETNGGSLIESILVEYHHLLSDLSFGAKEAFQLIDQKYLGHVTMTVHDGLVDTIFLEEYFLPNTFAELNWSSSDPHHDDYVEVVTVQSNQEEPTWMTRYYAKYFVINDMLFTAEVKGDHPEHDIDAPSQTIDYVTSDHISFYQLILEPAFAQFYIENSISGQIKLTDADKNMQNYPVKQDYFAYGLRKSSAPYWQQSETSIGWQSNMDAIITALVGTNMNEDDQLFEQVILGEALYWKMGDLITGATALYFKDYYRLVHMAYVSLGMNRPIRPGYQFLGWFLDENFTTPFILYEMPGHDITLYAKWHKI